jgi:LacI family transcriptional regulator
MARGFPFATHGRTAWAAGHAWADFDNGAFGRIAVRRLRRAGRRRLALLAPPLAQNYARDMVAGTLGADGEAELLPGITSDSPQPLMQAAVRAALARGRDGFVCGSPGAAMAAVAAIEAHGLRLGRDADLVSKEAVPFLQLVRREIMVVPEDVGRAGEVLARPRSVP